jgi:8-amino-3,8-dideoxy-alpha-D-manno-octulosonate transaminase
MDQLKDIKGISFAALPDPSGDSSTFLNILFDTPAFAEKVVKQMQVDGIGGFNYWFTNMYHFINQWTHIKELKTAAKLPIHILGAPQDYTTMQLPKAQEVIGRLVSFGIRCTWTREEMDTLLSKIKQSVATVG